MTLTRLVLAWLPVAAWLFVTAWVVARSATSGRPAARDIVWTAVEAALLTLLASLWFDSLGSNGWWLLFLLIGALRGVPPRPGATAFTIGSDIARYVVAGGILAWRLR